MDSNVVCVLCNGSEENKVTGALSTKEEVTAHENCLLFSSGLYCRESPQFDDLFGFSAEDVLTEKQRGRKLTCNKCKIKGATVGCENKRCQKSYHYPCAIQAGARAIEDRENGRFGLYCPRCKKTKFTDSNSSNASSHTTKRKLDFIDGQEKKARKCSRPIISDDSDSEMVMLAPLESDIEENDNSALNEPLNGTNALITPGTRSDLEMENQDNENAGAPIVPSGANSEQSLLLLAEATNIAVDASNFWRECASAGCTQAIFSDFIREITDIFTRITSGKASKKDCDVAFNVIVASGKFEELVVKQQKDIEKKVTELKQAAAALKLVSANMKRKAELGTRDSDLNSSRT